MTLKEKIQKALGLSDDSFSNHYSDMYVVDVDGRVYQWLKDNYSSFKSVTRFRGNGPWEGKRCLDIPFAHEAFWEEVAEKSNRLAGKK